MFKQLRNRFLILNLVIISVMMLISFTAIYLMTYQNVHRNINEELSKASDSYGRLGGNFNGPHAGPNRPQRGRPDRFDPLSERSVSFIILVDNQFNIISKASSFNIDDSLYENAKKAVMSQKKAVSVFKINDTYWAYTIDPAPFGQRIVFIDITSQQGILTSMIYIFLIVAIIMVIFIYFISRFFANRSIKPVQDAFDKQQQFIADASHELKTPLTVINTNVDLLLSNSHDTISNQSKWLYYIKSQSERMSKLTNDLLYLTQMDASDNKMNFADFDLSEIVENVILPLEAVIFEHNISLNYEIEPGLITNGNSEQLREAIMILLDNALKYTNEAGSVNISLKKHYNELQFIITNTGKGIPSEDLDRIFDRFYRTDKSRTRNSGGYGLGLAIAKSIINNHKGRIYVKSIVNESTSFYIELPLTSKR